MPRTKTPQQIAAGKLVSAIQKVQSFRSGTPQWHEADAVMNRAHSLHMASVLGTLSAELAGNTVAGYLGADWVACHPGVVLAAKQLEVEV